VEVKQPRHSIAGQVTLVTTQRDPVGEEKVPVLNPGSPKCPD
jgi:hypothetical protein